MTHIPRLTQDRQALVEGKLMHLRLHLALAMRALREEAGFTQQELAETLGIQQAAVSKLESHTKDHKLESIVRQLSALDAELLVAVKKGDEIFQVSDDEEHLVVDVPTQVSAWARECELDTRDYVLRALDYYHDFNSRSPVTPRTPAHRRRRQQRGESGPTDIEMFEREVRILEEYGLARLMEENDDEVLGLEAARAYAQR